MPIMCHISGLRTFSPGGEIGKLRGIKKVDILEINKVQECSIKDAKKRPTAM